MNLPEKRSKTFFFVDFEKVRQQDPNNLEGIVPTDLERTGDFSQSPANSGGIYDPCAGNPEGCPTDPRNRFSYNGVDDVIPPDKIDSIGQAILNLYPHANIDGAVYPDPNFRQVILSTDPAWQFDVKVDHQFNSSNSLTVRYSYQRPEVSVPPVFGIIGGPGNGAFAGAGRQGSRS